MQRVGLSPSISGCEGPEPWSQTACIQIQLPPLTACVTLGKLNNLSVPQSGPLRDVHGVIQRRGRKKTEVARRIRGESKGERQIQPVISSLSVLHSQEHTKRFTELGREEKWEGGDRGDLVEKKESPKGERAVKPVISLPSKNEY